MGVIPLPSALPNDNRSPAGTMRGDTLDLQLEVRMARWYPESDSGSHVDAAVFAEEGKAPQIPGPLIRVRTGTIIAASVHNALTDSTIWMRGLRTRPATMPDSVPVKPGETRQFTFAAGAPGTYLYMARTGSIDNAKREREQLGGAFVIDSVGRRSDDRIFVLNIWGDDVDSLNYTNALAINGKSWPYDERIQASLGDTLRWRVVNASHREHPMHLHGFYYRVDARGNGLRDTTYSPSDRRLVVTETLQGFETMAMVWSPDRPGNWLFHCHIGFHVVPGAARLDLDSASNAARSISHDASEHMAGLVLGIDVAAPTSWHPLERVAPKTMRLLAQEGPRRGRAPRAMGYVLQHGAPPSRDSIDAGRPLLVMHVGEPTDITVVNHLNQPTAVHWHGIELESFSDGVAGWSGSAGHVAPMIAPNDSFVAHLTLKRAGTFIYHTHLGDLEQLTSGLYGGIVVLKAGARFDPSRDHVFVIGWDGGADPPHVLVNGDSTPLPLELALGVTHRLRFVNIGAAGQFEVRLARRFAGDSSLVEWQALAKDGADLPASQATKRPASFLIDVGETDDFVFTPDRAGEYQLVIPWEKDKVFYSRRIIVRH